MFVFALPYLSGRISIQSAHDIVNVRLLSICPPDALRPYFQEGNLAGTADVTTEYDDKTELDFKRRLVAKFAIPNTKRFWGQGQGRLPRSVLYPGKDRIQSLCARIRAVSKAETLPGDIGRFVALWSEIEEALVGSAQHVEDRILSVPQAIRSLSHHQFVTPEVARDLDHLRRLRNEIVHKTGQVQPRPAPGSSSPCRAAKTGNE